jgi:ABC-2 type transport system ATP-binding protein
MSELVIETNGLTKQYGELTAVDDLSLNIEAGEIFGLLGPNGSGKTTTILMLLGLTEPTEGQVRVLGLDPARQPLRVKARVGYMPDEVGFYDGLTARENLMYIAKLNGLRGSSAAERIEAAIDRLGLHDAVDKPVGTFSRGMRQRLGVAEQLLKHPQIIIMDEPTVGLDPEAARLFLEIVQGLKAEGITILLSSHLLHQVQETCDRVALFYKGKIALEGTVPELARETLGGNYRVRLQVEANGQRPALIEGLRDMEHVAEVRDLPDGWIVLETTADLRAEAASLIVNGGGHLKALDIETPSLDEIYARYFEEVEHAGAN